MRLKHRWIWALTVLFCFNSVAAFGEDSGSMFTSLLKTLSSSNVSPSCPGRCFNAILAAACTEVLDEPGLCSNPGYRCCRNPSTDESEPTTPHSQTKSGGIDLVTDKIDFPFNDYDTQNETPQGEEPAGEQYNSEFSEKSDDELLQYSAPTSLKVCPGVCVAARISDFCEALVDVEGLCKPELRCCVPATLFDGVDNVPKEFIVLNPPHKNRTEEQPPSKFEEVETPDYAEHPDYLEPSEEAKPLITSTSTSTSSSNDVFDATAEESSDTERDNGPNSVDIQSLARPPHDENDRIPPEKRCPGTCIAGFFAFLCDSIERSAECPNGGRCCVTKQKPTKNNNRENRNRTSPANQNRRTTIKPRRRKTTTESIYQKTSDFPRSSSTQATTTTTSTTTTTEVATTISTYPPLDPCPGKCLPVSLASRCREPSHLVMASGCREDEVCCDGKKKEQQLSAESNSEPASVVPAALDTLMSLFSYGSNKNDARPPKRRPVPPKPTTTTTTTTTTPSTTTTTTTTEAVVLLECPGSCIQPFLSFTCFGNAEISKLFTCNKDKQRCCAPKSAIREVKTRMELSNSIARNDTVFTPPFNPHGTYVKQQYPQGYEYGQHHYYAGQEGATYQYPPYHPVPPPHQHPLPPPPPTLSQPVYESHQEHNNAYSHIPQEAVQQESVQQSYPYPYPPEDHTPSYQHQPAFPQNQSIRYPYPPPPPDVTPASTLLSTPAETPEVGNKYVCGVKGTNRAGRVVGGEDSIPGEWCWQVALINSLNQYLCGGALIGTQWVLTAAHCVTNIVRSGDAIYVRVGDHDLTTRYGSPGAQTIPVATTYIHHNHNSQTLDNDIALLKLSSHAELGEGVCLVCLPARGVSQNAGKRCTVTGYGYMGETGPIPLRVREAEIPVVSDNECVRKINAVTEKIFILPASSFCAGGESGHDACQGDGGGPLVCNVDNYYELSGLVSWGFGCGRQDVPGVYVKVSSFIGWVNQIIRVNN